jgi:hypothetical protein
MEEWKAGLMINSWIKNNLTCGPVDLQVPQANSFRI